MPGQLMMETEQRFEYSKFTNSLWTRIAIILIPAVMLLLVLALIVSGKAFSLFTDPDRHMSDIQNHAANLLTAFFLSTLCFLLLLSIRQQILSGRLSSVVVSSKTVKAPYQGVLGIFGPIVEIHHADIISLQKLSVDGDWEFNIASSGKRIRIPAKSLKSSDDFKKMIECIQKQASHCELKVERRINLPTASL